MYIRKKSVYYYFIVVTEKDPITGSIDKENLPKHIAVIMDGNGRWAKKWHKPRIFGHRNAVKAVRSTIEGAAEIGIKYLTLYAFSTENWKRPRVEVNALMELLVKAIHEELDDLHKNDIRLITIGDVKSLPQRAFEELQMAIEKTKNNKRMTLVMALSYSSRWEITEAAKRIIEDAKNGLISVGEMDENRFSGYLSAGNIPEPELMIRTSGEYRLSNFLLWQLAYAELFFTEKLWPDFRKTDLFEAIRVFQKRERRFGLTSEQIKKGAIK